ncbi:MAG: hypothetical protein HZA01_01420 [Nitrospinae bacterium]|nr:hypothetical protein [Nitrospinota bacterium]
MKETMEQLERKRKGLRRKIEELGDLRRGIISVNYRKCGKSNCACAKEEHSGHGPQYLWNATIKGKSHARNLKLGPEISKYMAETANYRRFVELCDELVVVNERICNLRPVPDIKDEDELSELKKNCIVTS